MKGQPKLHILYKYQLNTYLIVDSVVKLSQKIAHNLVRDIQKFGGQILKNVRQI